MQSNNGFLSYQNGLKKALKTVLKKQNGKL